jgi:alpha-galactosidase
VAGTGPAEAVVTVDDGAPGLSIVVGQDGIARITRLNPAPAGAASPATALTSAIAAAAGGAAENGIAGLPLADVLTPGTGRRWSGTRYVESVIGSRLRYLGHTQRDDGPWREVRVELTDPGTGLRAEVFLRLLVGHGVLRAWTRIVNEGREPVNLDAVSSFLCGGMGDSEGIGSPADLDVRWAESEWLAEGRWQCRAFADLVPSIDRRLHPANPRGCAGFTSTGSWSTDRYLPMGALVNRRTGQCWAWQVEHNGGWHWQVGEAAGAAYLALLGPTAAEHQWQQPLLPGACFTTVPVAVAVSADGLEGAIGALTAARRATRRPHQDHQRLPVIFNDYMNTLMGDPTTAKLLPLISAAAKVGAEYFCVDAGWYDHGAGWWDSVGDWLPAPARFPGGFGEVVDHIRAEGMIPGIWLEPETTGVRTAAASELPQEAFFHSGGVRVAEHGRFQLDLRHPAAVALLDKTADYLVGELGIGYLKLDYNIKVAPGTDLGGISPGAGLLGHNRALLEWLDRLADRYPDLTIENCASGGMRADYAMLSRLQIQSTSDQQGLLDYPVIAAAAPAAMTPEQAGIWAYPQPASSEQENAFTLCGALLGRIHLSGHLDQMSSGQQTLVARAISTYKVIRSELPESVPFWPLGLPQWADDWVALGLRGPRHSYLLTWRRGGSASTMLPIHQLRGAAVSAEVLFPAEAAAQARWDPGTGTLTITMPYAPSACLLRLTA